MQATGCLLQWVLPDGARLGTTNCILHQTKTRTEPCRGRLLLGEAGPGRQGGQPRQTAATAAAVAAVAAASDR
jgi:hypothetical protein